MKRKRLVLHLLSIFAIFLFAFLAISTTTSTPAVVAPSTPIAAGVRYENIGNFGEMLLLPVKDFASLGLVFTEVQFTVSQSANNVEFLGNVMTYQALLKEAHALGADAIINVVIDRLDKTTISGTGTSRQETTEITWYGSALAIRYTNVLTQDITLSNAPGSDASADSSSQADSGTTRGFLGR